MPLLTTNEVVLAMLILPQHGGEDEDASCLLLGSELQSSCIDQGLKFVLEVVAIDGRMTQLPVI